MQLTSQSGLPLVQRVGALLLAHQAAALRGMTGEAAAHAEAALSLAEEAGYTAGATRARLYLAIAANQARECSEAERLLYEELAQQDALDSHLLGIAQYELARTYEAQREYQNAIQWYRKAAATFHECGQPRGAAMAHQNAAWLALRQGQVDQAETDLASAGLLVQPGVHVRLAHQLALEAMLQYEMGNSPRRSIWQRSC